ncbi:MAG: hypothetical protein WCR33_06015 [Bacilli bacterium]
MDIEELRIKIEEMIRTENSLLEEDFDYNQSAYSTGKIAAWEKVLELIKG